MAHCRTIFTDLSGSQGTAPPGTVILKNNLTIHKHLPVNAGFKNNISSS